MGSGDSGRLVITRKFGEDGVIAWLTPGAEDGVGDRQRWWPQSWGAIPRMGCGEVRTLTLLSAHPLIVSCCSESLWVDKEG